MHVSGKILVFSTFAIGLAMAAGAWWYNYQQSYRTAEFWGRDAGLLVGASEVALLEFGDAQAEGSPARQVVREVKLTDKPGLVHLRYALVYDADFAWDERRQQTLDAGDWPYALRFTKGDRQALVLFSRAFDRLGRMTTDAAGGEGEIEVLPCPRLGPAVVEYLGKVGVKLGDQPDIAAPPPR
jgi:hypothetical protein